MNIRWLSVFVFTIVLCSCATVGPDYEEPGMPLGDSWNNTQAAGRTDDISCWWKVFDDPLLDELVEGTIRGNHDLAVARSKLREARALKRASSSALFPSIDSNASGTRSKSSGNTGGGSTRNLYSVGLDAGWEIDLFGGTRRSIEASEADEQATREELHDITVSLVAETALNYIELRTLQSGLDITKKNMALQQKTMELADYRHQAGIADELDLNQAIAALETTRARIPAIETSIEETMNRIEILSGKPPGSLHERLSAEGDIPAAPPEIASGVPADIIRQRPDIRKAERNLASSTARTGAARAELYPKLRLTGSIGLSALSSGDLISSSSRTNSFGPGISWPVFNAGNIRAAIDASDERQEQSLSSWKSAVLEALGEVENTLRACGDESRRNASLEEAARARETATRLSEYEYAAGLIDLDRLIDNQESLLSAENQLNQSTGAMATNLVSLYKALGGGWQSSESIHEENRDEH